MTDAFRRILLDTPQAGYIAACAAIRDADLRMLAERDRCADVGGCR